MNRPRRGRHEASPLPIATDHDSVRDRARASILTHLGYQPRHRKAGQ